MQLIISTQRFLFLFFFLNRHQSSEMLNVCESNENVYFGGNRGGVIDYSHLGFPYNIDRSEQETTTEL